MTKPGERFGQLTTEILREVLRAYHEQRDPIPDSDLDNEQPISLNIRLTLGQGRELNLFEDVIPPRGPAPWRRPTNNANVGDPSERDVQVMLQAGRPAPNFRELKDGKVPNSKGPLSATEMNKLTSETPRLRCPECGEWNLATHFIAEAGAFPKQPVQLSKPTLCEFCTNHGYSSCPPWRTECPHNPASLRRK